MSEHDRAWADYSAHFRSKGFPALASSAVMLSIYSGDGSDFDVKQATELGAALLLDKPLLLVCLRGSTLPTRLRRAADVVLDDVDMGDKADQDRLTAAIEAIVGSSA